jgi:PAS domain S-box-containing protein
VTDAVPGSNETTTILIVDDDESQRVLMREALAAAQYQIEEATSGEDALQNFAKMAPDLVLLDVDMPGIDGYQTLENLRRLPLGSQIPVVMVTGLDDGNSIDKAYQIGATDFITKPLNWTILRYRVRYLLRASRAFLQLQKSQVRLAAAQRLARLGYWEWTPGNDILDCSSEIYHIFGFEKSNRYQSFEKLRAAIHPGDYKMVKQAIEDAAQGGSSFAMDHRIILPSGEERVVHHQAAVTLDMQGHTIDITGAVQDITERKQTEAELRRAKEEIELANRLKTEFINNISHEVRTPMNGVLGMLSLLRETRLDKEQQEYLDTAYDSADVLMLLLNNLLDFSQLDTGKVIAEGSEFSPPLLLQELINDHLNAADSKTIRLDYSVASDVPQEVTGNLTQIRKILAILVDNAIKFTEQGAVLLCAKRSPSRSETIRFEISDTGKGISADAIPHIFEPFVQVDGSSTRQHGGMGMGLAICKQVADNMGYGIGVESALDEGSTFWLEIPCTVFSAGANNATVM